jgi:iron complex transport system substrate-binding protein
MRILSLLPSSTEILFQLGLGDQVVGSHSSATSRRALEADRLDVCATRGLTPSEIGAVVKQRMAAGEDLYRLDRGAFAEIDPTLVVTQDLCAVCAVDVTKVDDAIAYLGCHAEILTLDPMTLSEVIESISMIGAVTDTADRAAAVILECRDRLGAVTAKLNGVALRPTLLLEWTDPAFTDGHWVPDMIAAAGGRSVMGRPGRNSQGRRGTRSTCECDVVIVAPCGPSRWSDPACRGGRHTVCYPIRRRCGRSTPARCRSTEPASRRRCRGLCLDPAPERLGDPKPSVASRVR